MGNAITIHYFHRQTRSENNHVEYSPAGDKRLEVTSVWRESGLDCTIGAALSVDVTGRGSRTLLMAKSAAEAEALVRLVERRLLAAASLAQARIRTAQLRQC